MSSSECKKILENVISKLEKKSWFKKEAWVAKHHGFPIDNPEFQTLHVFKKNWFNEEKLGIHIESFLAHDPKKRKKSYVTVHLLHYPKIPNTNISRKLFAKDVVDSVIDLVKARNGYKIRTGKYGLQPFAIDLDGSREDFVDQLDKEIAWLCRTLGKPIDTALSNLIA